ncbi:MAG: bifunctional riboflavin kinase/FAD synthetase [Bryobacterales bacterium]|nr:bifunctional riboflavin kinase/FAD synthetase [Bryobacteraceae bacterium]MDW8354239.1 bifunctional riboflavin kinase/FAD synthetase [Bryobacterales bacterium]
MSPAVHVCRSLAEVGPDFGPCALSIGNFDGVHAGHRRILRRVVERARERGWKAAALTFDPHPAKVVAPDRAPRLLTTPEERCGLMAQEGIDQVLILPFGPEIAQLSPEEFARYVLRERLNVRAVLVGSNFRFGYRQSGDVEVLRRLGERYGFETEVVPPVQFRGRMISSSEIRRLIQSGQVLLAARLLERPHFLEGDVVPGHGVGAAQTVPTLNLRPEGQVLPATGVYVTETLDRDTGTRWPSVTNVGYRPTFGGKDLSVESYLLDGLEGAPPRRLRVEFLRRLRDERKFESVAALKTQILRDAARARAWHRRVARWVARTPAVVEAEC